VGLQSTKQPVVHRSSIRLGLRCFAGLCCLYNAIGQVLALGWPEGEVRLLAVSRRLLHAVRDLDETFSSEGLLTVAVAVHVS